MKLEIKHNDEVALQNTHYFHYLGAGGGIKFPRMFYPPPFIHCQGVGVVPFFLIKKHLLLVV